MSKSHTLSPRQRAELPTRVVHTLELRHGNAAQPIPGKRRQDPKAKGGRAGGRQQLRREAWKGEF